MSNVYTLEQFEDNWQTSMGAWFPGERVVFRGKDLFRDVSPRGWVFLLFHGISGREFSDAELEMLEAMMTISGSFPDPRLWNNRVAALAGTARSSASLGFSAATAVTEAQVYGHGAVIRAFEFIEKGVESVEAGEEIGEFSTRWMKKNRHIPGFGRPVTDIDERIEPLLKVARRLKLANGKYLAFALKVESFLKSSRYKQGMNAAGLVCALAADMGVSMRDFYMFSWLSFLGGIFPCYIDASQKPEGAFFPLSCKRINYIGKGRRTW